MADLLERAHEARLLGQFDAAADALNDAAERSLELDDDGFGALNVALERSNLYLETDQPGEAAAALEWAWSHPIAEGHPVFLADIQVGFGRIGLRSGMTDVAVECFEAARATYEEHGELADVGRACRYLGQALGGPAGKEMLERAVVVLADVGDARGVAMAHEALATIASTAGDRREAERLAQMAREGYLAVGDERAANSVGS